MRIDLVSVHASPLAAIGGVDAGGQNVHVAALAAGLARRGHGVTVHTRRAPGFGTVWYLPKGPGVATVDQLAAVLPDIVAAAKEDGTLLVKVEPELRETPENLAGLRGLGDPVQADPGVEDALDRPRDVRAQRSGGGVNEHHPASHDSGHDSGHPGLLCVRDVFPNDLDTGGGPFCLT